LLQGLGQNTAYRLARGEVNVSMATLAAVCDVLEVDSISELIDVVQEEPI
jgi:DNA-binding Xre family transcriptional regulator